MSGYRKKQDAFGQALYSAFIAGQDCFIVERDDGCFYDGGGLKEYLAEHSKWPKREKEAIKYAKGRVLDIGAGAGRHALYLQKKGHEVTAIDNSPLCVRICAERGIKDARLLGIEEAASLKGKYDTVLLMCNNFGLFGKKSKAKKLLRALLKKTSPNARLIAESYEYHTPFFRDYIKRNLRLGRDAGDLTARIRYGKFCTPWFEYFRVTKEEMKDVLKGTGWMIEKFINGQCLSYVAIISKAALSNVK